MRMIRQAALVLLAVCVAAGCERGASRDKAPVATRSPAAEPSSSTPPPAAAPYAGLESRSIKALSPEDVDRLLAGEGMGYALAAELNHYPGPRHVLDLADSLALTADQRGSVRAIRERMNAAAVERGRALVASEAELDSLFAQGAIDGATLRARTARIGAIEGELRAIHLQAHLETRAVLTDEQVARYDALRGYGAAAVGDARDAHAGADAEHTHR